MHREKLPVALVFACLSVASVYARPKVKESDSLPGVVIPQVLRGWRRAVISREDATCRAGPATPESTSSALSHAALALSSPTPDPYRRLAREPDAAEDDIARGICEGEFLVHYQPVVDARTLSVASAEALLRWNHPEHGLLRPHAFITYAERSGQILALDRIALHQAATQVRAWQLISCGPSSVSVNCSALHFSTADPLGPLLRALGDTGCPPELIDLELTENVLIGDVERAIRAINAVSALGISLTIDDFGVEYAALNYLRRLPARGLKIDRSFVVDLDNDKTRTIVAATIRLAHRLGLRVTAEGVETRAQEHFLRATNCDFLQGYRYGAPMAAEDLEVHLAPTRQPKTAVSRREP